MNRFVPSMLAVLILGGLLTAAGPANAGDDDAELFRKIMQDKSASLVTVKFLMKVHLQQGVQERDQEFEREVTGMVVSSDGLIMVSNTELNPQSRVRGLTITGHPVNFKILFPGDEDEEEYDAVLAATDSNLNLAFVAMKDPKAHELTPIDFGAAAKAQVAQQLIGVGRLARGYDFAPFFGTARVTAKVAKPRKMFLTAGSYSVPGGVLFDRDGAPVGVQAFQESAGGGGRGGLFLLPADVVKATIKQAAESAKQVLAEEGSSEKTPGEGESHEDDSDDDKKTEDNDSGEDDDGDKKEGGGE